MKQSWSSLKAVARWLILGGTLLFVGKAFVEHWQEVATIRIDAIAWAILSVALGVTLLAHTWAGWVWTWVLRELNQPIRVAQFIQTYLKTNLAKYLPGNVWHYYGRVVAAKAAGVSPGAATLSVLLEPLLMAAAALIVVLAGSQFSDTHTSIQIPQLLGLVLVLGVMHPLFLNPTIRIASRFKKPKSTGANGVRTPLLIVRRYPLRPLLGELGFLLLRGTGFILTVFALKPLELSQVPMLLGAFSLAWLLGLVVPVAPGGLGVFEATALILLQQRFSPGILVSAIALYRLVSILAETAGAVLASLDERL